MSQKIDLINIGLILITAVLAYLFPLELFIFSFAILGPLHYLTEINWLHSKNYYFTQNKLWLWIGAVATTLIVIPKLFIEYTSPESGFNQFMIEFNSWTNGFIFITIMIAIGYHFVKSKVGWIVFSILILIGAILLNDVEIYISWIGLFVPTIVHVYLFTALFMIFGARKSNSKLGFISVALLLLIPFLLIPIDLTNHSYVFADGLKSIFIENNFHVTPVIFGKTLGLSDGTAFFFYESLELKLMMFLSFIYLYHYLNWFSKTTVIKWYKSMNVTKTIIAIVIWGVLLFLFYTDFRLGLLVSLFFNMLHVILEFPLNVVTIRGLFSKTS